MTTADDGSPPPARHTARWVAVTVLVIAAGLIAVLATRPPASVDEVQNPVVGKVAPPVSGRDPGRHPLLAAPTCRGSSWCVSFFASWCEQCQNEGPELVAFQFQHQRTGDATMLSVMFSDSASRRPGLPVPARGDLAHHGRPGGIHRPRLRRPPAPVHLRHRSRRPGGGLHRLRGDRGRARPGHRQGPGRARVTRRRFPLWTAAGRGAGGGAGHRQRRAVLGSAHRPGPAGPVHRVVAALSQLRGPLGGRVQRLHGGHGAGHGDPA